MSLGHAASRGLIVVSLALGGLSACTGPTGPIGPAGPTGAQGLSGPTGPTASPGSTGPTGPTGPQGATGVAGASPGDGGSSPGGSGTGYALVDATGTVVPRVIGMSNNPWAQLYVDDAGVIWGLDTDTGKLGSAIDHQGPQDLFPSTWRYYPTPDCSGTAYAWSVPPRWAYPLPDGGFAVRPDNLGALVFSAGSVNGLAGEGCTGISDFVVKGVDPTQFVPVGAPPSLAVTPPLHMQLAR
ncbi:MAG TPA: hypothetical protein VMB50_08800 [Myxococcales bacterium]|nr:hypothetical protein [Myxococcales bacterium]